MSLAVLKFRTNDCKFSWERHDFVQGVVGDHCERCDVANHYTSGLLTLSGPPSGNVTSTAVPVLPTCYYDLQLDFQFTFNLSKKEDRHIRQINFRNVPLKPDLDLEFNVMCSGGAKINISVRSTANAKAWSWNEVGNAFVGNHSWPR